MRHQRQAGMRYVDRGDPSAQDKTISNFTIDGAWHDLDLSGIIPSNAKVVHLRIGIKATTVGRHFFVRKKGNTNLWNTFSIVTEVVSVFVIFPDSFISCGSDGIIEYLAETGIDEVLSFVVRGWFI